MALVTAADTVDLTEPRSWRRTKDRIATGLMVLATIVVTLPLGWVVYAVIADRKSTRLNSSHRL